MRRSCRPGRIEINVAGGNLVVLDVMRQPRMKHEFVARPPGNDPAVAVRQYFDSFVDRLETDPSRTVIVLFGFAWGNEIYEHDWLELTLTGTELRDRVANTEADGLGRIASDDLHITIPELGVQILYCHESDIHVIADSCTNPYLISQQEEWQRNGWNVTEQTVA